MGAKFVREIKKIPGKPKAISMHRETRELVVVGFSVISVWVALGFNDSVVAMAGLVASWLFFVCLCISHRNWSFAAKLVATLVATCIFVPLGFRIHTKLNEPREHAYPWLSVEPVLLGYPGVGNPAPDTMRLRITLTNEGGVPAMNPGWVAKTSFGEPFVSMNPISIGPGRDRSWTIPYEKNEIPQALKSIASEGSILDVVVSYSDLDERPYEVEYVFNWLNSEEGFSPVKTIRKRGFPFTPKG